MRWSILVSFAFCLPVVSTQPASATRLSNIVQRTLERSEMRLKVNLALRRGGVHKVLRNNKWTGDKLFSELAESGVTHGIKGLTRDLQQQVDWLFKRADKIESKGQIFRFTRGNKLIGRLEVLTKKVCTGKGYNLQNHISLRSTEDHPQAGNYDFDYRQGGSLSKEIKIKTWSTGNEESALTRTEQHRQRSNYKNVYKWSRSIAGEVQTEDQHLSYTAKDGMVRSK